MATITFRASYFGPAYLPDGGKIGSVHISFNDQEARHACINSQSAPHNQALTFHSESTRSMKVIEVPSVEVANTISMRMKIFYFRDPLSDVSYGLTETESSAKYTEPNVRIFSAEPLLSGTNYHIQVINTEDTIRAIVTISKDRLAQIATGQPPTMMTIHACLGAQVTRSVHEPRHISVAAQQILRACLLDDLQLAELQERYSEAQTLLKMARKDSVLALKTSQNTEDPKIQKAIDDERKCLAHVTALALALIRKEHSSQTNTSHT